MQIAAIGGGAAREDPPVNFLLKVPLVLLMARAFAVLVVQYDVQRNVQTLAWVRLQQPWTSECANFWKGRGMCESSGCFGVKDLDDWEIENLDG